jgi:hypothetical protein
MARPYDPVKNVSMKKETWRLGVIIDDMWIVYKGDTEDHLELLVRDIKVFCLLLLISYSLKVKSQLISMYIIL